MSYQDDPNRLPNRMRPVDYAEEPLSDKDDPKRGSSAMLVAGVAALALVLAIGIYAVGTKKTNVTETKPTVTETRSTTGSGTTSPAQQK